MEKEKSIKKNFIMNGILTASSFIFPLISYPYVTRMLMPSGTGRVEFASSLVSYFIMFAMLGIPTYGIRACARVRDDKEKLSKTVQELLIINLILAIFCYAVLAAATIFVPRLSQDAGIIWISAVGIILNVIGVNWFYSAIEEYTYITIRSLIFKVIAIIFMFIFIHGINDYPMYSVMLIITSSGSYVLNFIRLRKHIYFKRYDHYDFRPHIKATLVFFAMAAATTIYTNLDSVMLGFMKDNAEVGYYAAAVKVKQILVSFVTALGAVLLPRLSFYFQKGRLDEFKALVGKAMQFVFFVAVPLVVFFIINAKDTILILSGDAYLSAVLPMQIIMPTVLLIGITNILGIQIMIPIGREKQVAISVAIGAVVDLIINLILIPPMGAAGAAIGTLVAEAVVLIVQVIMLRDIPPVFKNICLFKIPISAAAAGGVSVILKLSGIIPYMAAAYCVQIIVFFGVYTAIELLLKDRAFNEVFLKPIRSFLKGRTDE